MSTKSCGSYPSDHCWHLEVDPKCKKRLAYIWRCCRCNLVKV